MAKKKAPKDICPQQERFPTTADGLVTTARPTAGYVDYPTESGGEFEITQPDGGQGHDCFQYRSTTKGKREE